MASAIVRFLLGEGRDSAGRTLADVLAFDDRAIERRHDFIQWLFPLTEASSAVPGSPVLTEDDIAQLAASEAARMNMRTAAERMMRFYSRTRHWLVPSDHNHLRISRIIRSLRLLVGDHDADGFKAQILERVAASNARVSDRSRAYWAQA
jgi:hypothetical protein